MFKILLIFLLGSFSILADSYHNINDLIGERATGMGGAFTAISDDPSGIFYNPAGLSYAHNNSLSASANVYNEHEKRYQNVFGKGADYVRKSRGFNPSFIGTVKQFGELRLGFAIVNIQKKNYDQADQFFIPQTRPNLSRYRVEYTENNDQLMLGGGFAYPLTTKLSLGGSMFYNSDLERITSNQIAEGFSGEYSVTNIQDRRKTISAIPILGVQYAILEKVSLGLSLKRKFNIGNGQRNLTGLVSGGNYSKFNQTNSYYNTQKFSTQLYNGQILVNPAEPANMPELPEVRMGIAYFQSTHFRTSFDLIYTGGNVSKTNRNSTELTSGSLILRDSQDPNLHRVPTLNYAAGLEYFLTENIPIKLGMFTNYANSKKFNWLNSALDLAQKESGNGSLKLNDRVQYVPQNLENKPRFENVDIKGYTFGLGYETATSSISVIYVHEYGKGNSQVDQTQLPQTMLYRNQSLYIIASSSQ